MNSQLGAPSRSGQKPTGAAYFVEDVAAVRSLLQSLAAVSAATARADSMGSVGAAHVPPPTGGVGPVDARNGARAALALALERERHVQKTRDRGAMGLSRGMRAGMGMGMGRMSSAEAEAEEAEAVE